VHRREGNRGRGTADINRGLIWGGALALKGGCDRESRGAYGGREKTAAVNARVTLRLQNDGAAASEQKDSVSGPFKSWLKRVSTTRLKLHGVGGENREHQTAEKGN